MILSSKATADETGASKSNQHKLVIEAGRANRQYWADLWHYHELFAVLAWRDIAVRYKQTVIGVAWAVIRPLLTMAIFTVIFGRLAGLPSEGEAPYMLMVLAGTLPWFLFSTALGEGSNSLVSNANMIRKIYFPRLISPVATMVVSLVDAMITLGLFFVVAAILGFLPDWRIIFLPLFIIYAFVAALGPTLLLAALTAQYRDFRFVTPFIVQFGMYVSPVGFASSVVPQEYRLLYNLNPMASVIDGFRWSLLRGEAALVPEYLALGLGVSLGMLWLGLSVFRSVEKSFADVL
ncbi:lipopolysaccharide transport system permease protein [Erythromicrobium ramosum]|uniref:Transport permease protein n=1 Tax=Erythrobacter ramosus TaxID=35811 RepID=A0A6I4UNH7_9SPHN|nr:ABC transporter permease [Erythrobacter ramosus]MBB3777211.1 lipopolysaccharide transport system permease protein [Erythrobacter ramosus]MXP39956.1 ABC transporter permease [Erythrobacter ramosus]